MKHKQRFSKPKNIRLDARQELAVTQIMDITPMNFAQAVRWLMNKGWDAMQKEKSAELTQCDATEDAQ